MTAALTLCRQKQYQLVIAEQHTLLLSSCYTLAQAGISTRVAVYSTPCKQVTLCCGDMQHATHASIQNGVHTPWHATCTMSAWHRAFAQRVLAAQQDSSGRHRAMDLRRAAHPYECASCNSEIVLVR